MRILVCHNYYQQPRWEDAVFQAECDALRAAGHEVYAYEKNNRDLKPYILIKKFFNLKSFFWSKEIYDELAQIIKEFKPDVAHFHNIYYMITPSAYSVCKDEGVPVVQSLHNFRMICANGLFLRENTICEKCLEGSLLNGVIYQCYRNIFVSAFMYLMIKYFRTRGIWPNMVDRFVVSSEFTKTKYERIGIPSDKIFVKPNFMFPEPLINAQENKVRSFALYVGRLSNEKGIDALIEAWKDIDDCDLKIVGDGILKERLYEYIKDNNINNVELKGYVDQEEYDSFMRGAKFIIVPSVCYENFSRIILEAFAYGLPVLATRLGSLAEIVQEGKNGLLFTAGDISDLTAKIKMLNSDREKLAHMRIGARMSFEENYSAKDSVGKLVSLYEETAGLHSKEITEADFSNDVKKILVVHNCYQAPGGEDEVVDAECKMLEQKGHKVIVYKKYNKDIDGFSLLRKIRFGLKDVYWSTEVYQEIRKIIQEENPDVVHVHNTFFLISPSVYYACFDEDVPVVQTLHNYRMMCPIGTLYRESNICEECMEFGKKAAVLNKCWRNSYVCTYVLSKLIRNIEKERLFLDKITHFIAPSLFAKNKYCEYGIDAKAIYVKPHFIDLKDKNMRMRIGEGKYVLFVGALFGYKGVGTLLDAWKDVNNDVILKIVGDGPLRKAVKEYETQGNIEYVGRKPLSDTIALIRDAIFVIVPSQCYETFSRVIIEAFACGVPVIASDLGALKENVDNGVNGMLFESGNSNDLAEKIDIMLSDRNNIKEMGENAFKKYEEKYTPDKNYEQMLSIYKKALSLKKEQNV